MSAFDLELLADEYELNMAALAEFEEEREAELYALEERGADEAADEEAELCFGEVAA